MLETKHQEKKEVADLWLFSRRVDWIGLDGVEAAPLLLVLLEVGQGRTGRKLQVSLTGGYFTPWSLEVIVPFLFLHRQEKSGGFLYLPGANLQEEILV